MPRIPRLVPLSDGKISVRVDIPASIAKVCEQFAQDIGIPTEAAIRMLLKQISHSFDEGDAMFLSKDFQAALRVVREKHFGVINESAPLVDLSKVHRSARTKSGFVGVYANGKGFRAMGKTALNNPALKSLGTYPTAEEAAWRRFLYYREHNLPYGALEEEMERWRSGSGTDKFTGTDEELIAAIRDISEHTGQVEELFGVGNIVPRAAQAQPSAKPAVKPTQKIAPIGIDPDKVDEIFGSD